MTDEQVETERNRRLSVWQELKARGGPVGVSSALVRELKIYSGQMGVFRDQKLTGPLTPSGSGIAVGLLHTGAKYEDDLYEDGLIYHYPVTDRGGRDQNEIAAMKACGEFRLPVFVVTTSAPGAATKTVHLGWVVDHDDASGQLLITFSESPLAPTVAADEEQRTFELKGARTRRRTTARARPGQGRFRFAVFKRYGPACAFCSIADPRLLDAAHLCPVEEDGTDDPRNALVMCLTHHKAFDVGLLLVHPDTMSVLVGPSVAGADAIGVTVASVRHLTRLPHQDALQWVWSRRAAALAEEPAV